MGTLFLYEKYEKYCQAIQPERMMLAITGIVTLVQHLDKNNPDAVKRLEEDLQKIINQYTEKYKVAINQKESNYERQ